MDSQEFEQFKGKRSIDLTNMMFGNWLVLGKAEDLITKSNTIVKRWKCECQCENKTISIITSGNLRSNRTKGCVKCKRNRQKYNRKYNKYDLSGEYGIGYTSNTNEQFYFDLEDYDKIKDYCWYKTKTTNYVATNIFGKKITLNNFLKKHDSKYIVDHYNRNKFDNRKENLIITTKKNNCINKSIQSNNKSGFVGVRYDKLNKKWISTIGLDGKDKWLGRFVNKEDAIIARLKAEKEYFGEFAPQRHLFDKHNI
jgi:hypothetical protein